MTKTREQDLLINRLIKFNKLKRDNILKDIESVLEEV